jgi:hypothetical protein
MNTTITLRSLLGAAVASVLVAGCGAEQGPPADVSGVPAQPPSLRLSPCDPTSDPLDRIIARRAGSDCQAQRRNDDMHRLLGHT